MNSHENQEFSGRGRLRVWELNTRDRYFRYLLGAGRWSLLGATSSSSQIMRFSCDVAIFQNLKLPFLLRF